MVGLYNPGGEGTVKKRDRMVGPVEYGRTNRVRGNFDSETMEHLPTVVQGKRASDKEGMMAQALGELEWAYDFRQIYFGTPGQTGAAEVDFVIFQGSKVQPLNIDFHWTHKTALQKMKDAYSELRLNDYFEGIGYNKLYRVSAAEWVANQLDDINALKDWLEMRFG